MSDYINFNGNIIHSNEPVITADNRGFRFGDGIFETIRVAGNSIELASYHFDRLFSGMRLLQFDQPDFFTPAFLSTQIIDLCRKNDHLELARVRLVVFRGNGGLYDPETHFPNYILQSWPLNPDNKELNKRGLAIAIFADGKKAIDKFSNLKTNNYLLYAMAALYATKYQFDDCLILNSSGFICDSAIANIFCIRDKTIFTPPLSEGCVAGVMRRYLLERLPGLGFEVRESQMKAGLLETADEIFLTNSIGGIRWVEHFGESNYKNDFSSLIHRDLIKNIPHSFNL